MDTIITQAAPEVSPVATELALLKTLAERYTVFAEVRPLAIGIHDEILADWPGLDSGLLKAALKRYVMSFQYRKVIERKNSRRIHLDGSDAGEVSETHRQPFPWMMSKKQRRKQKKPKSPTDGAISAAPVPASDPVPAPVNPAPPPDPPPTGRSGRPVLTLKAKTSPVTTATVTRKEAK